MARVYDSGAFVQQCFAVHPLCLSLKRFDEPARLVFTCSSCKMVHEMSVREVVARLTLATASDQPPTSPRATDILNTCVHDHALAVTVYHMDVLDDAVGLRCGECRRVFDLSIAAFQTRQK